jgi:hypothetical protein
MSPDMESDKYNISEGYKEQRKAGPLSEDLTNTYLSAFMYPRTVTTVFLGTANGLMLRKVWSLITA